VATNRNNQLSAARVKVFIADQGTAAPVGVTDDPATGWIDVGLTDPASLSFATSPEFNEVPSHQSDYPVRRIQTGDSATVSVDLLEWKGDNLKAAYGGGTITSVGVDPDIAYKFVPPALGARDEKSLLFDVIDQSGKTYRLVFPSVMQVEGVQADFQKGEAAKLPLRFAILGDDTGEAWYILSDDPALDPAGA
jgi:hypothetical protein